MVRHRATVTDNKTDRRQATAGTEWAVHLLATEVVKTPVDLHRATETVRTPADHRLDMEVARA